MSTQVQSNSVPLQLSFDGGATWKDLICLENYIIQSTTATTTSDTFCGRFIGLGPIGSQVSGSAVCDVTPLATQVSMIDLKNTQAAGSLINVRANWPTAGSGGGKISNNAVGYVTATDEQFTVNNLVKFTFTLLINGAIV